MRARVRMRAAIVRHGKALGEAGRDRMGGRMGVVVLR